MLDSASGSALGRLTDFGRYMIGDVFSEQNERYRNRIVGEIAAERGEDPFATIVDIVAADDLRTVLWPLPTADTEADWKLRRDGRSRMSCWAAQTPVRIWTGCSDLLIRPGLFRIASAVGSWSASNAPCN